MKKTIQFFIALFFVSQLNAQVPQRMTYQAVVRNINNSLITNTSVGMKVSILSGNSTGPVVYAETHTATTNANGLLTIEIGNGAAVSGTFASINWASGSYQVKTESDPTGGSNYTIIGTSPLLSVPYALYAANGTPGPQGPAGIQGLQGPQGIQGPQGLQGPAGVAGTFSVPFSATVNATTPLIEVTNSGASGALRGESASTSNPAIHGKLNSSSGGGFVAAVRGENTATGLNGIGVYGSHAGTGWGVYGQATNGTGVYGSVNATGGAGILGNGNGAGYAGIFQNGNVGIGTNAPNNARLEVWAPTSGTNAAIQAISTTTSSPALEISGPVKVSGVNPAAFIVQGQNTASGTNGYTLGNQMLIDNPICNGDPNAILLITHNFSANNNNLYTNFPIGVYYNNAKWIIFTESLATMPLTAFNVLVIKK